MVSDAANIDQNTEFPTDLPPKYYHSYFGDVLGFVRKRYEPLLTENERNFLNAYAGLSEDAQCLFIRFSNRRKSFFRTQSVAYKEIDDIQAALQELDSEHFIEILNPDHTDRMSEVIDLFTKEELLQITRNLEPDILPSKSIKKPDLVRWLLFEYDFEKLSTVLLGKEPVVKVSYEVEVMMMKFLFFGNRYADMTEFVVRDLGHVRFQSFNEDDMTARFESRKDIEDALIISLMKEAFYVYQTELPPEEVYDWFMNWRSGEGNKIGQKALPSLERFTLKVAAWLEKKKMLSQALGVYQLTNEVPSRERRVRLLLNLGETDEAIALCDEIVENPKNAEERFFSLDFKEKILNKKKRTVKRTTQALKAAETIEVPVSYRNRVELGAIEYFRAEGYEAFFSENEPWRSLFGLLFWDIIYDTNVQAIHNPLQRAPSDFFLPDFYIKRAPQFADRIKNATSKDIIEELISKTYRDKFGMTNVLVSWYEGSLDRVKAFVNSLNPDQIHQVMQEISFNMRENTRGFPDLFIYKDDEYSFIEIKSPTDHLSSQQLHWQHFFEKIGIKSKIVRVKWGEEEKEDEGRDVI